MLIALYGALSEPSHRLSQLLYLLGRQRFINWISFTMVVVVAILIGTWLLRQAHLRDRPRWRLVRGMAYGAVSGILSAHCLLIAKSAVELLVRTIIDKQNQFKHWQSWIILLTLVVLALTQLYYLHLGLKLCSTSVLYPFVFCVYNVIAILDGLIYFRQMSRLSAVHAGLIALGTVILLSGVVALSWRLQDDDDVGASFSQSGDLSASTPLLGHSRARSSTATATLAPGLYVFTNSDPLVDQQEDNRAPSHCIDDEEAHAVVTSSPAVTETSPLLPNSATSATSRFSWFSRHKHRNSQSSGNSGHNRLHRSRRSSRILSSTLRKPRRPVTAHETAELWAELNDNCDGWVNSSHRSGSESYLNGFSRKRRSTSGVSFSLAGDVKFTDAGGGKGKSDESRRDGLRLDSRRASSGSYLASKSRPAGDGDVAAGAGAPATVATERADRERLEESDISKTITVPQNNNSSPTTRDANEESTLKSPDKYESKAEPKATARSESGSRKSTPTDNIPNSHEYVASASESASTKADDTRTSARNDDEAVRPSTRTLTPTSAISVPSTSSEAAAEAAPAAEVATGEGTNDATNRSENTSKDGTRDEDDDEDRNRHKATSSSPSPSPPPNQEPISMLSSLWRRFVVGGDGNNEQY